MPYSKKAGKPNIVEWVAQLKSDNKLHHKSVLDIGVGEGTYLNWLKHRYQPKQDWQLNAGPLAEYTWTGVEIWTPYIKEFDLTSLAVILGHLGPSWGHLGDKLAPCKLRPMFEDERLRASWRS